MTVGALPRGLTSFIGRELELRELADLLASVRLLTVGGAGGVGKTRLAAEVGAEAARAHRDGACWVDLAPLADPALVPGAVMQALGVGEVPGQQPTELLIEHLRGRHLLLLLDNCEHLAGACAALAARLLPACPGLRILATSRERLGVEGEAVWRVPPLGFPEPDQPIQPTDVDRYAALRLFVERARAVEPLLRVDDATAVAIAKVCRQLDGIPLAIELAAAWTRALSVEQIADRLEAGLFRVLRDPNRGAVPRHQTLRAAFDWSHDLLGETERAVLRRLAPFSGGAPLEAAEAVCGAGPLAPEDVLDVLAALADKSLVVVSSLGGETRYRLLEPIRQYADERLEASGEAEAVRRAHRGWYLAWAERAASELTGPDQVAWFEAIAREYDNLCAALVRSLAAPDGGGDAIRIAVALGRFWHHRGRMTEGRAWLGRALERAEGAPAATRALGLMWAGQLQQILGDAAGELPLMEASVAEARRSGDRRVLATALRHLGYSLQDMHDPRAANTAFGEALGLARDVGDENVVTRCMAGYGWTTYELGGRDEGRRYLEECVARSRAARDPGFLGQALLALSWLLIAERDLTRARPLLEEAWAASRVTNETLLAPIVGALSDVARHQGDLAAAWVLCREALAAHHAHRRHGFAGALIRRVAKLLVLRGDHARAARLFGAGAVFEGTWRVFDPLDHADEEVVARAAMGDQAFETAWAAGRAMTLDAAIAAVDEALASDPPSTLRPPGPLSPREAEVAVLVAQGRSNREIAEVLVIAESTADRHLANIFNKLGLHSRAELAVWHERQRVRLAAT